MKKLLVLVLVLAMTQMSLAVVDTVTLRIAANDFRQDYRPSDMITLELVANYDVSTLAIGKLFGPGEASAPVLNVRLTESQPVNAGVLKNTGTDLIWSVAGSTLISSADITAGTVLWSFEYHVPDLPPSTTIQFGYYAVDVASGDYSHDVTTIGMPTIHIVPEPMTIALLGLGGLFLRRRLA